MNIYLIIMAYLLVGIVATVSVYFIAFSQLLMGDLNYTRFLIAMRYLEWGFVLWPFIVPLILIVLYKSRSS